MNEERVSQQVREGLIERARQMSSRGKPGTGYVGAAPLKAGQAKINSDKLLCARFGEMGGGLDLQLVRRERLTLSSP
jgi:hypothetical protein